MSNGNSSDRTERSSASDKASADTGFNSAQREAGDPDPRLGARVRLREWSPVRLARVVILVMIAPPVLVRAVHGGGPGEVLWMAVVAVAIGLVLWWLDRR